MQGTHFPRNRNSLLLVVDDDDDDDDDSDDSDATERRGMFVALSFVNSSFNPS